MQTLLDELVALFEGVSTREACAERFARFAVRRLAASYCDVLENGDDGTSRTLSSASSNGARAANGAAFVLPVAAGEREIVVKAGRSSGTFGPRQRATLLNCTRLFGIVLDNVELAERVERLVERSTDEPVTGVHNRRGFDERLRTDWRRAMRDGTPVAVALVALDGFAAYEARYGAAKRDECLRHTARAIAAAGVRSGDYIARFGADRFAIVMPSAHEDGALALCDRVRSFVALRGLEHAGSPYGVVTASIGVASDVPGQEHSPWPLVAAAQRNLERAKTAGRNRVASSISMRTSPLPATKAYLPPPPAWAFVGRTAELTALGRDSARWTTLYGASGCGKTALALESARRWGGASAYLALGAVSGDDAATQIGDAIRNARHDEPLLLVLDDVAPGVAGVAHFAAGARQHAPLYVVATAAQPLSLAGERALEVGAMNEADARALVREITHDVAGGRDASLLAHLLEGNPFALAVGCLMLYREGVLSYLRSAHGDDAIVRAAATGARLAHAKQLPAAARTRAAVAGLHAAWLSARHGLAAELSSWLSRHEDAAAEAPMRASRAILHALVAKSADAEPLPLRGGHGRKHELSIEGMLVEAQAAAARGRSDEARTAFERVVRAIRAGNAPHLAGIAATRAAFWLLADGNHQEALSLLFDAARAARAGGSRCGLADALDGYVYAACLRDRHETALRLYAFVASYRDRYGVERPPFIAAAYERLRDRYRLPQSPHDADLADDASALAAALAL